MASLRHHVALQPLFLIMGVGMTFVALYVGRLASKTTDVNWTKKNMEDQVGYYENRCVMNIQIWYVFRKEM